MSTLAEIALRTAQARAAHNERIIRHLLGQWVSEFEPSIAMRNGEVIGLCVAGDPSGSMPIRVMDMRPMMRAMMRAAGVPDDVPTVSFREDYGHD